MQIKIFPGISDTRDASMIFFREKKGYEKKSFHVEISISLRIDLANKNKSVIYTLRVLLYNLHSLKLNGWDFVYQKALRVYSYLQSRAFITERSTPVSSFLAQPKSLGVFLSNSWAEMLANGSTVLAICI